MVGHAALRWLGLGLALVRRLSRLLGGDGGCLTPSARTVSLPLEFEPALDARGNDYLILA
jgi:hypothetical protein